MGLRTLDFASGIVAVVVVGDIVAVGGIAVVEGFMVVAAEYIVVVVVVGDISDWGSSFLGMVGRLIHFGVDSSWGEVLFFV
jgi:hypothetical protein